MIELVNLSKTFKSKEKDVEALKNVNLKIEDGDIFGIIGMSGAGKSTLVRCINMLEKPSEGTVLIDGVDMKSLSNEQLRKQRRDIAMIFQGFNLLMQKNCLENVMFPLQLLKINKNEAKEKALQLLETVGLKDKAYSYPAKLSGGQQQRVAIARALTTNPKVLLCDEATSALDPTTTQSILELIRQINEKLKLTVIVITHQMSVVESICHHVAILDQGEVVEQGIVSEVFSNPKSRAAQALVFPEISKDAFIKTKENERYIRVVFNGAVATEKPLIAQMAIEKNILASITYASTKSINNKMFGSMLLIVEGDDKVVKEAIDYLMANKDITAQEVTINV